MVLRRLFHLAPRPPKPPQLVELHEARLAANRARRLARPSGNVIGDRATGHPARIRPRGKTDAPAD